MIGNIHDSWNKYLQEEMQKPYFENLIQKVEEEYKNEVCYPKEDQIFAAFNYTPFQRLKS